MEAGVGIEPAYTALQAALAANYQVVSDFPTHLHILQSALECLDVRVASYVQTAC